MTTSDVDPDEGLVRRLLEKQHPDLAVLPLERAGTGWDNAIWRLGEDLAVRLPRRASAVPLLRNELRWLPVLARMLPVEVPTAVRIGEPGPPFPWPWAVVPWFDGSNALDTSAADLQLVASEIGALLVALHRPAPPDAPANPVRGVPLATRSAVTLEHLDLLEGRRAEMRVLGFDVAEIRETWLGLVETPSWEGPPVWVHGDLHPGNVILRDGTLVAVIDFGDLCAGDPATDLVIAWAMFARADRALLRAAMGSVDEATWQRGQAWALAHGIACAALGDGDVAAMGLRTLRRVLADG